MTIPAIAPELSPDDDVDSTAADDDTYEDADDDTGGDDEYETASRDDEEVGDAIGDVGADDIGRGAAPVELLVELNRVTTTASTTNA